ncbi:MAG: queuosine precursor transporter [Bacteroidales bacterium]|nr:queuosine precursor transporter [Bacteroidales bacterium]
MHLKSRKDIVFIILAGFFITNAVVGEVIGGKLIQLGPFSMSIGIIPWPVVFLTTDLINEYFGKQGVRKLTLLTAVLIGYTFLLLFAAMYVKASHNSPVQDEAFNMVFGQSLWIIVGSITAFMTSQLIDVFVFWMLRKKTGERHIWLRATGSTVISQLIDTFIVTGIAFYLPGKLSLAEYLNTAFTGYSSKLIIAVILTPFIYIGHSAIDKYIGKDEAHKIIDRTAHESLPLIENE